MKVVVAMLVKVAVVAMVVAVMTETATARTVLYPAMQGHIQWIKILGIIRVLKKDFDKDCARRK